MMNLQVKMKRGKGAERLQSQIKSFEGETWYTKLTFTDSPLIAMTHLKANQCEKTAYFKYWPNDNNDVLSFTFFYWDSNIKEQGIPEDKKDYIHATYLSELVQFLITNFQDQIESIIIQ